MEFADLALLRMRVSGTLNLFQAMGASASIAGILTFATLMIWLLYRLWSSSGMGDGPPLINIGPKRSARTRKRRGDEHLGSPETWGNP